MIHIGWQTADHDEEAGYMNCPVCRTRKAGASGTRKTYLTLFILRLFPVADHEGFYRCDGCQTRFDIGDDYPFDFGSHPSPKAWDCRHCQSRNTNLTYRCPVCGADA